ncbi:MAG: galactosyldiacylglycerol synthase [Paenibacillus sp.]|nr:galactosyldiacylglycerol synthase [Paenibacillus sp.]
MERTRTMNERILILTGRYGEGHRQAALALQETYEQTYPGSCVRVVDYMEWMHPHTHEFGRSLFVRGVCVWPSLYGFLFERTREPGVISKSMHMLARLGTSRMMELLNEFQPTMVVSTFPPAAAALSVLKEQKLIEVPTVTVITDHTDHSYWVHPCTDRYLVGSDQVRRLLQARGISSQRIRVTGIPIRSRFYSSGKSNIEHLREKHGLRTDQPVILLMGGGCGLIGAKLLRQLESPALTSNLQFIVCCGHNHKAMEQLKELAQWSRHHILPIGFVDHIDEYMALADLVITKAGGLSTTEAIAMQLPILLYRPLPGQEEDNAKFLLQAGVALRAEGENDLVEKLEFLLGETEGLAVMKDRAAKLNMGRSAERAVKTIAGLRPEPDYAPRTSKRVWTPWRTKLLPTISRLK